MACTDKIQEMYINPEVDECIKKFVSPKYREDFKQELFLILCQIPCETIQNLNGSFKFYVVRVILNLVRQKRNVFYRTYLDKTVEYNTDRLIYETGNPAEIDTITERQERENREAEVLQRLKGVDLELGNNSFPVHEKIIELTAQYGNIRKVSIQTGIPYMTVSRIVKKVRNHLT